jgi:hypothetical protein
MNDEEYRLEEYHKLMEEYRKNHRCCPKCGSDRNSQTLMGIIPDLDKPNEYKDENRVSCANCKWGGIVHNLVGDGG